MRATPVLVLILCLSTTAHGGEEPAKPPVAPPAAPPAAPAPAKATLRPKAAADQFVAAFDKHDAAATAALVATIGERDWEVATELLDRRRADAAAALAAASKSSCADALVAYVERERTLEPDRAAIVAIAAANEAFSRRDFAGVVEVLDHVTGRGMHALSVARGRSLALTQLGRFAEARAAHLERVRVAKELGCRLAAARAYTDAASVSDTLDDLAASVSCRREAVALHRTLPDEEALAGALIDLAKTLEAAHGDAEARPLVDEGIALARRLGKREFLVVGLLTRGLLLTTSRDLAGAEAALLEAVAIGDEIGPPPRAWMARSALSDLRVLQGRPQDALALLDAVAAQEEKGGADAAALTTIVRALDVRMGAGDLEGAVKDGERAVALATKSRDAGRLVAALRAAGRALHRAGRDDDALAALARALDVAKTQGRPADIVLVLTDIGAVRLDLADYAAAEAVLREALPLAEHERDGDLLTEVEVLLGNLRARLGDGDAALAIHRRIYERLSPRGPSVGLARAMGNLGFAHLARGDAAQALTWSLRAREMFVQVGARQATEALSNVASVYRRIGDTAKARETMEKVVAEAGKVGDPQTEAIAMINLGSIMGTPEDPDEGRATLEAGLALARSKGYRLWQLTALVNLAALDAHVGTFDRAQARWTEAIALAEGLGARNDLAFARSALASTLRDAGHPDAALAAARAAVEVATELDGSWALPYALAELASTEAGLHAPTDALTHARAAADALTGATEGIPTTLGISTSDLWQTIRVASLRAAKDGGDLAAAFELVERSRSAQLLDWLGGREAFARAPVPPGLAAEERTRRAAVLSAQARCARARAKGELAEIRAARDELGRAEAAHAEAIGRLQLEARSVTSVTYPHASTLAEVRQALPADAALVSYALVDTTWMAFVVTKDAARLVELGAGDDVEPAVEALVEAMRDHTAGDLDAALAAPRKMLVAPLGLDGGVHRLVVVPDRGVAFVPFAVLVPDRTVTLVASATTWRVLDAGRRLDGERVLALGDAVYGSALAAGERAAGGTASDPSLAPLPATRDEAKAVGDVVLLGAEASETGFVRAIGSAHWRGVHIACHGLVDADHPMRSALALTSDATNDGYLQVAEICALSISTDLVTLSACETGRGRAYASAGVVGLTSAFLVAGASRVVCSLWNVDDEATRALMTKFYELWNPKQGRAAVPPAEALRKAQEFVRSQERWKHPYYWAAWVLWGLPD